MKHDQQQTGEWADRAQAAMSGLVGASVALLDEDLTIRWASDSFDRIFGYDPSGTGALELLHPDDVRFAASVLRDHNEQSMLYTDVRPADELSPTTAQMRIIHRDGRWLVCSVSVDARMHDPAIGSLVVRIERRPDRSAMSRALDQLAGAAPTGEVVETVLEYIAADTLRHPLEETFVVWWDDEGSHVAGSRRDVAAQHPLVDHALLVRGGTADGVISSRVADLPDGPTRTMAETSGYASVWTIAIGESGAAPLGAMVVWSASKFDLELRPEMHLTTGTHLLKVALLEAQRRRVMFLAANTDQLTGLRNRTGLRSALDDAARHGPFPLAALFVDLDHFKDVNDTLGHEAGDIVLATVASRLKRACSARDVVVRLGGDEFVVLRPFAVDIDIATLLTSIAEDLSAPISLDALGRDWPSTLEVGASIGVAVAHDRSGLVDLLARADKSLYRAKRLRESPGKSSGMLLAG